MYPTSDDSSHHYRTHLLSSCSEPLLGIILVYPTAEMHPLRPGPQCFSRSIIVIGTQFDDMPSCQPVALVQLGIVRGWMSRLYVSLDSHSLSNSKVLVLVEQRTARQGVSDRRTYVATKFSVGPALEPAVKSSVPPTICLTTPACRSMHGRNWDLRRLPLDEVEAISQSSVGHLLIE